MRQVQWFDQRFYQVISPNGIEYFPSVTTILSASPKPYLAKWRGDIGNEAADRVISEAKHRGSSIHAACETLVKGGVVALSVPGYDCIPERELRDIATYRKVIVINSQDEYLQVWRYARLLEVLKPEMIETELTVYSIAEKYAGTLDILMFIQEGEYAINGARPLHLESGTYIGDIKSGNAISDEHFYQIAAYRHALIEHRSIDIIGGLIIHTNADTKKGISGLSVKLRTAKDLDTDYENFDKIHAVWRINPSATAPMVFEMPALLQWQPTSKQEPH